MIKQLFIYSSLALILAGCSKKTTEEIVAEEPVAPIATYMITEDFENTAAKTAYAAANVNMPTGSWNLDDAVVGNLATDLKNGAKSIRLRNGKMTMNFDVSGMKMLYIKHGKFGADAASTWQLMMSIDGGTTFTQVGTDINDDNSSLKLDSFAVTTTAKVRFQIKKTGNTRINLDDITFRGTGDPGIAAETPDIDPVEPVDPTPAPPATPRGVTAGTDAQPAAGDNSNALFGNPSTANMVTPDNFLIDQSYYVQSYSSSRGTPNWVSWHLDASNMTKVAARKDDFAGFIGLPATAFQVQSNSYSGSGFDRGHNIPSADRSSSANANSATFLMTNMIPQAPQNNQQTWRLMEEYLRNKVLEGNEVYIIMGSYGAGGVGSSGGVKTSIADGKVTVPANVWKIAVIIPTGDGDLSRVSATTRVIAVNTPNINTIDTDWKKYRVTVRAIEQATGYDLLSQLPKTVQDAIETKVDTAN
ncbi:DNA/RNA non-specific endonuclease [Pedobacter sp. MR2016-24]|uniref:DNA/RNA non-specific endonuclease n=1 Tax=Pedobacter sp. MR2016-24 TaxID=2994466 RepID=UPI0022456D09|nr:DNA/RNA non-specific endonuclease [Pedobacter sp. MR2016-24]MCX2483546.1 DNA/RNA non-specific endonuclease [Pedobacter sp. MR2016-24]